MLTNISLTNFRGFEKNLRSDSPHHGLDWPQ